MFKMRNGRLVPSPGHALAALGRVSVAINAGTISPPEAAKIRATARQILKRCKNG
jgi:hypothetical protein